MKTIDQVKEDLAHEYGFKTWRDMYLYTLISADKLIDEVAKRYAAEVAGEVILICEEHSTGLHKEDALAITLNLINELK